MFIEGSLACLATDIKYTLNSEPKALTGDKSEDLSPVKAEGEEFNVLILSYTRELSQPFKETKGQTTVILSYQENYP